MSLRRYQGTAPRLAEGAYVDELALVVGDVELGADASVWPFTVARGDVNAIRIGARSNVQDNCTLHCSSRTPEDPVGAPLTIGEDVTVGHGVILHGCTIGDRVLVGMGSIVLDRAIIEDEVLIAAGSLVPPGKRLKSGWMYRGSPAQPARELTARERASLRESALHYVEIKQLHQSGN